MLLCLDRPCSMKIGGGTAKYSGNERGVLGGGAKLYFTGVWLRGLIRIRRQVTKKERGNLELGGEETGEETGEKGL